MKKIDIHCHTSPRKITGVVPRSATLKAIAREMEKHEIGLTVLLATYFPHKKSGISNFRLYDWVKDNKRFIMFGSLDFEHYFCQGYNELEEMCTRELIKGIKVYTCYQKIDVESPEFNKVMKLARDWRLPVMFHAGYSYASKRKYGMDTVSTPHNALTLEPVAKKYPEIKFIFSHMSKPFFHDMVEVVKRNDNIFTDMSGLIDSAYDYNEIPICIDEIKVFISECGSERLLFGTDFPVQTHKHSIQFIEGAVKNKKDKENIYYKNSAKILGMERFFNTLNNEKAEY